jgi:hypothetical protein
MFEPCTALIENFWWSALKTEPIDWKSFDAQSKETKPFLTPALAGVNNPVQEMSMFEQVS